ncbi:MAG: peptidoglycan D,D-transpeptidase FtsI family protein [Mycobacteriales bacterium]
MNPALRRLSVAALALFGLLFVNVNYLQTVRADALRNDPRNTRQLSEIYSRERGQIVAGGAAIAESRATSGRLKYLRVYPRGRAFANLTGYFSLVYSRAGLEQAYEPILSGDDDRLFVRRLSDLVTGREPQGGIVKLTVDPATQDAAVRALGNKVGAVVALDPRTGAVLAQATSPSYDPNDLAAHDPDKVRAAFARYQRDPHDPLLDRATQRRYPPGSVFKLVTTAAALSSGRYNPETRIPSPPQLKLPLTNRSLRNFEGESCSGATSTLADALRISCNTAYAGLGLALGADALKSQARRFGFGGDLGDYPLPIAESVFPDDADRPQTALSAIGQYEVAVTPMQMAVVAAAIANRGLAMQPYVVDEVEGPDLSVLSRHEPRPLSTAVSPSVAAQLTQMMQLVVTRGTGTRAQVPGVAVAGKTGTAQNAANRPPYAWFIGFAPAAAPRITIAVLVESGASGKVTGGLVAAPIFRTVMETALARGA